jgi:DNA-binding NtrC family response regulator
VNIVVVDDEPAIVRMCTQVLQSKGHTVHGFTRTDEALTHLGAQPADLIVVDYKMPELNGLDFVRRAWELRPAMRVVMITAHGTRELMSRANETGVHTVVLKPFTPVELVDGVGRAASSTGHEGHQGGGNT